MKAERFILSECPNDEIRSQIEKVFVKVFHEYFKANPDAKHVSEKRLLAWLERCAQQDTKSSSEKARFFWTYNKGSVGLMFKRDDNF